MASKFDRYNNQAIKIFITKLKKKKILLNWYIFLINA